MGKPEEKKIIDARGYACPKPVLMTRKEYDDAPVGALMCTMVDTRTAAENVRESIESVGGEAEIQEFDDHLRVDITKTTECAHLTGPATQSMPHVIYIGSDRMGRGEDDLGRILMKAFVSTLKDVTPLPSHLIFMNSGIFLSTADDAVIDTLKELESLGVRLISCGTCLDYYERTEMLKVGSVSNMFDILETMSYASSVISP